MYEYSEAAVVSALGQIDYCFSQLTNLNSMATNCLELANNFFELANQIPGVSGSTSVDFNSVLSNYESELYNVANMIYDYALENNSATSDIKNELNRRLGGEETISDSLFSWGSGIDIENYDGQSFTVNGVNFPIYYQYGGNYSSLSYGNSTLREMGCGPISLAVILSGLTGEVVTPEEISENAADYYDYTSQYQGASGSEYPGIFSSDFLEKNYGVSSTAFSDLPGVTSIDSRGACTDMEIVQEQLDQGNAVIASVGIGSSSGHIIALLPVSDEDKEKGYNFYIYDSTGGSDTDGNKTFGYSNGSGYYSSIEEFYSTVSYVKGNANDFGARFIIY